MTQSIVLDWTINSTNQTEQHIYRKIDDLAETPLAVVGATVNTYEDTEATSLATANVTYRVESVGVYRGVQTKETSLVATYTVPAPSPDFMLTATYMVDFELVSEDGTPFSATVDFGDGHTETFPSSGNTLSVSRYYTDYNATYNVSISYTKPLATFMGLSTAVEIKSWGETSCRNFQIESSDLIKVPSTLPGYVTSADSMFYGCSKFNQDLSGWDTTNITNMRYMFGQCTLFNGSVTGWNTSNVTNMDSVFSNCSNFNQPVASWNTSKVTTLRSAFAFTNAFNQPVNTFDTSSVTDMVATFQNAFAFNQPLDNWNLSNVTMTVSMFNSARIFNQDISGWNTSKVTLMDSMFIFAEVFNQNLSQWCVGLVPALPDSFVNGAPLMTAEKLPVWGTCPRGENAA